MKEPFHLPLPRNWTTRQWENCAPCYVGLRSMFGCSVAVHPGGHYLDPRTDVRNHSPSGFEWSYQGSGPAQLALAMLCHADDGKTEWAERAHQAFKRQVIAKLPKEGWRLLIADVRQWITENRSKYSVEEVS